MLYIYLHFIMFNVQPAESVNSILCWSHTLRIRKGLVRAKDDGACSLDCDMRCFLLLGLALLWLLGWDVHLFFLLATGLRVVFSLACFCFSCASWWKYSTFFSINSLNIPYLNLQGFCFSFAPKWAACVSTCFETQPPCIIAHPSGHCWSSI